MLGLLIGACAPHRLALPALETGVLRARYERALAARETRGAAVEAEVSVWAELESARDLPGAEGRLLLAGPDAFRLRVGSLFGAALDVSGRGDSLVAWVPVRRMGVRLDARRDTLGVRAPGLQVFRALGAVWHPPADAWERATWRDSLRELRWVDAGDSVRVAVGSSGLPQLAAVSRPGEGELRAAYRGWDQSGAPWPSWVEIADAEGRFRLTLKCERLRFPDRLSRERLTTPLPEGTRALTLAELRHLIERLGS